MASGVKSTDQTTPSPAAEKRTGDSPSRDFLTSYLRTSAYCVAVALLLWFFGVSSLGSSMLASFCIGSSIHVMVTFLEVPLEQRLGPWVAPPLLVTVGVFLGVVLTSWIEHGEPLRLLLATPETLVMCLLLGIVGYLIVRTRGRLLNSRIRVAELERAQAQREAQLADTRLKLLQAQIEPHFLFNTMGTIQSLIEHDPARGSHVLEQLTKLLRHSLARTREGPISLGEEMEVVRAYLEIQAVRMDNRLHYELDVPPALGLRPVPPLLVQPLVENAVVHGIEPRRGPGRVDVKVTQENQGMVIRVTDNGNGMGGGSGGTGTALANIRTRLREHYGPEASFRLLENPGAGMCAELTLPLLPEPASIGGGV